MHREAGSRRLPRLACLLVAFFLAGPFGATVAWAEPGPTPPSTGPAATSTPAPSSTRPPVTAAPVPATTQPPATAATAAPPPETPAPAAYILVDLDANAVVEQRQARTPLPPASLSKILTALVVSAHLAPTDELTVSPRAAGTPANRVGMIAGQTWKVQDAVHALLLVSGNDAAMALAERVAGSVEAFGQMVGGHAKKLGFADPDIFRDPSGLDDEHSVGGGNLISARDLAIATRALLADPWLAGVTATPRYRFTAPDGIVHDLRNHNKMLLGRYPGTIGGKTGYTRRSGHHLIAAATRNGRTMFVVLLDVRDTYGWATRLLDKGFATPVSALASAERLGGPTAAGASGTAGGAPSPTSTGSSAGGSDAAGSLTPAAVGPGLAASPTSSSSPLDEPALAVGLVSAGGLLVWRVHTARERTRRRRRVGI